MRQGVPDGYHTITPYLQGDPADGLIRFLEAAFAGGWWSARSGRTAPSPTRRW
jgi:hypothetical protein